MQQKFCIECGNRIVEGAKFCAFCGTELLNPEEFGLKTDKIKVPEPESSEIVPEPVLPAFSPEPEPEPVHEHTLSLPVGQTFGAVTLIGPGTLPPDGIAVKEGRIFLNEAEMAGGVTKVINFGTGKRFEVMFPAGMHAGDIAVVKNTGLKDELTGADCEIRLTICDL